MCVCAWVCVGACACVCVWRGACGAVCVAQMCGQRGVLEERTTSLEMVAAVTSCVCGRLEEMVPQQQKEAEAGEDGLRHGMVNVLKLLSTSHSLIYNSKGGLVYSEAAPRPAGWPEWQLIKASLQVPQQW